MQILSLIKNKVLSIWNNKLGYWGLTVVTFIVSRLATWMYPFDSDHWIFYYVGNDWFHGGSLYVTAWDHKPPVIFFINGLLSFLGSNITVHRIVFTFVFILSTFLFYRLVKIIASDLIHPVILSKAKDSRLDSLVKPRNNEKDLAREFSKLSLFFFVIWANLQQFTSSANNNENFGMVFFLGMLLGYFYYRKDRKWWQLFVSGICFSVLFFMKGNFLLLGVPVGIFMIIDYWRNIPRLVGQSLIFVTPLFIQAGAWIAYFAAKGTIADFILASFTFSAKYSTSAWSGDLSNLKIFYFLVFVASPLIILQPLVYLSRLKEERKNPTYWYVLLTIIFGSFAFFAVGVPYLYYFQILMPIYVIISVYVLFSKDKMNKYLWIVAASLFAAGILANLSYSLIQIPRWYLGRTEVEAHEYREISNYVKENSNPDDKVFANDYGAVFYQLAGRKSGSRFISASVLLLNYRDGYGFGFDEKFISEMDKSRTKYVVVYRDRGHLYYQNKPITDYFDSHYHVEKVFEKYEVLRRN